MTKVVASDDLYARHYLFLINHLTSGCTKCFTQGFVYVCKVLLRFPGAIEDVLLGNRVAVLKLRLQRARSVDRQNVDDLVLRTRLNLHRILRNAAAVDLE
ncbi:hypothetical protein D3C76_1180080 [compost metagenome]